MEKTRAIRGTQSSRTARSLSRAGIFPALLIAVSALQAGEPEAEHAGVNSVRIEEPSGELRLREGGERRSSALANYYLGLNRENAGDIQGALTAWEEVLRQNPGQMDLAARAARLSAEDGDVERGLRVVEQAFQRNRDNPGAWILLSEYLTTWHQGNPESVRRALSVMEDAVKRFPDEPATYQRLVALYLIGRNRAEAESLLNRAMDRNNPDPWFWLELAGIASNVWPPDAPGNLGILNGLHERALELGDKNKDVQTAVADYYGLSGQYDRARQLYEQIVQSHPEELFAREKLARVYSILGLREDVLKTLKELEQINPHRLETQKFLAETFQQMEDIPNAVAHYQRAFRIARGDVREYLGVSYMLMSLERYEEAVELLERASFHYPDNPRLMIDLARGYNSVEDFDSAYAAFKTAEKEVARLQPESLDYLFYFSYGAAAERLKRIDEATALFRKSIELVPEDQPEGAAMPYNYLGYMWLEQDMNIEEAGQLIMMANELRPESGAYMDSLGWYYYKKKDYPKALETLIEAERLLDVEEQEDAVVFDHIAQTWYRLGHQQKAVEYMQKAVDLDADNKEFVQRMAEFRQGKELPAEKVEPEFLKEKEQKAPPAPADPNPAPGRRPAAAA